MAHLSITICTDPLSPTYSTLPRLNTTALLLFVLFSPSASWATKGALAALMAHMATISLHGIVLLATKSPIQPFDLDIIGSWFLLSEVAVAVPLLLCVAPSLKGSKARFLVRIWGVMVLVGTGCAFGALRWGMKSLDERSCSSLGDGKVIFRRDELFEPLERSTLLGKFDLMALIIAGFGGWVCLRPTSWGVQKHGNGILRQSVWLIETCLLILASIVLVGSIVLHEKYMFGRSPRIPMLEPITAYEQWSCWAATGLVVTATVMNWMFGKKKARVSSPEEWEPISTYPAKSESSDLEWAGVLGRPTPAHIS